MTASVISAMTTQFMSSDSDLDLMPKSGSLSGDSVWRDQIAVSMLIDLKPI
jgi:hypothetical protein